MRAEKFNCILRIRARAPRTFDVTLDSRVLMFKMIVVYTAALNWSSDSLRLWTILEWNVRKVFQMKMRSSIRYSRHARIDPIFSFQDIISFHWFCCRCCTADVATCLRCHMGRTSCRSYFSICYELVLTPIRSFYFSKVFIIVYTDVQDNFLTRMF